MPPPRTPPALRPRDEAEELRRLEEDRKRLADAEDALKRADARANKGGEESRAAASIARETAEAADVALRALASAKGDEAKKKASKAAKDAKKIAQEASDAATKKAKEAASAYAAAEKAKRAVAFELSKAQRIAVSRLHVLSIAGTHGWNIAGQVETAEVVDPELGQIPILQEILQKEAAKAKANKPKQPGFQQAQRGTSTGRPPRFTRWDNANQPRYFNATQMYQPRFPQPDFSRQPQAAPITYPQPGYQMQPMLYPQQPAYQYAGKLQNQFYPAYGGGARPTYQGAPRMKNIICNHCGNMGHIASACPTKPTKQENPTLYEG